MEEREVQSENAEGPMVLIVFGKRDIFQSSTVAERTGLNIDISTTLIVVRKRNGREGSTV